MKLAVIIAAIMAATAAAHAQPAQKSAAECGSDMPGKYMNLTPKEFDQTLDEGWREIGDKEGCESAAADLIAMYSDDKLAQDIAGLDWHEAQLRAASGDTEAALTLFRRNLAFKKTQVEDIGDNSGVLYAQATIAFLERDLAALTAARAELAAIPKPDWFDKVTADFVRRHPQAPAPTWPSNLNVVDGFIACFDKPYGVAYSFDCQPNPPVMPKPE